jgi:hypothetical protein
MTLLAKRFTIKDLNTNVPVSDLNSFVGSSAIINTTLNDLKEISSSLSGFLDKATQGIDPSVLKSPQVTDIVRETKGIFGNIKDLEKMSKQEIDKAIGDLFPNNPQAKQLFTQLTDQCKVSAMSTNSFGKPFTKKINCGSKTKSSKSNCDTGQFGNLINKITGNYNTVVTDANKELKNIMALASFGYKLNMCGVFNSLATTVPDKKVLSKAAAGIWGNLVGDQNITGIFDLAKSAPGLDIKNHYPDVVADTVMCYADPIDYKRKELSGVIDQVTGSIELIDESWNKAANNTLSIEKLGSFNPKIKDALETNVCNASFGLNALDSIPSSNELATKLSYLAQEHSDFPLP